MVELETHLGADKTWAKVRKRRVVIFKELQEARCGWRR